MSTEVPREKDDVEFLPYLKNLLYEFRIFKQFGVFNNKTMLKLIIYKAMNALKIL